jgi:hypothetical protein
VDGIEARVEHETGTKLTEPRRSITIRQRKTIGFVTIAKTMFLLYPRRTILGFSLFIGQAFLYNAITFGYAQILAQFFHVTTDPGYYFAVIAVGNLIGPLVLGGLFDSIGRIPMIAGTYILSGLLLLGTAFLFDQGVLTATTMTACWSVVLFFASAGASSAYLTVSEVFPMETRALAMRVLLRHRHAGRRGQRPAALLVPGQLREGVRHGDRLLGRGDPHDPGRHRGDLPRGQGRAAEP